MAAARRPRCLTGPACAFLLLAATDQAAGGGHQDCAALDPSQAVTIHEFLASNVRANPDLDFGRYSDWIELQNREDFCVDLSGTQLSDDLEEFWSIPDQAFIPAHGFLLVWADGQDTTGLSYHASFRLSKEGETIALLTPGGTLVDSVSYPEQLPDVSYGRPPVGSRDWFYLGDPTPGSQNYDDARATSRIANPPGFFPEGGFHQPGQEVTIDPGAEGGVIRFSTDGSIPNHRSPPYGSPIRLSESVVIRARTYHPALLPSETTTQTYLVPTQA